MVTRKLLWFAALLALILSACAPKDVATETAVVDETAVPTSPPPTATLVPPTATPTPVSAIPAEPQRVEFQTDYGETLVGYYFPSRYDNAPVFVLQHWAGGDKNDWCVIAPWLQNRQDENPPPMPGCENAKEAYDGEDVPWLDASLLPPMPENISFAVFIFDYNGFGESPVEESREGQGVLAAPHGMMWYLDALAALDTAAQQEGVNPNMIFTAGASIGADGAVDGCLLYNQKYGGGCVKAIAFSPGSFLGMDYADTVAQLSAMGVPVDCATSTADPGATETCQKARNVPLHSIFTFPFEGGHGMQLLNPDVMLNANPSLTAFDMLRYAGTFQPAVYPAGDEPRKLSSENWQNLWAAFPEDYAYPWATCSAMCNSATFQTVGEADWDDCGQQTAWTSLLHEHFNSTVPDKWPFVATGTSISSRYGGCTTQMICPAP